ncbi:MAG: recombinase family protein [Candidatus Saccharimonas sp.]
MAAQEKEKAVAYLRTSKDEVGDQLFDLHIQNQDILEFAKANAFTVAKSFDDFGGGSKPRLYDVVDYCRQNKDIGVVIARTQTRISRSVIDFQEWESLFKAIGVELKFVEQSVMGDSKKFQEAIMAVIVKQDSENRAAYIKRGLLNRVHAGYSVQKPPMGYVRTSERGLFAKDRKTATHLRSSIIRFLDGKASYDDLRRAVSMFFLKDKLLSSSKFKAIVTNPYYVGYVSYGGKQYQGLHEPLLTVAEHKKLITLLGK